MFDRRRYFHSYCWRSPENSIRTAATSEANDADLVAGVLLSIAQAGGFSELQPSGVASDNLFTISIPPARQ